MLLGSRWTKVVLFVVCLVPFLLLLWPFWKLVTTGIAPELGANPVEYITHDTGDWTIRFLLITLSVTPLRKIFNQPKLVRYRRMLGLFAFFYVCLHFMTWFILDKSFSLSDMWADVLKRRFITVGMLGLRDAAAVGDYIHGGLGAPSGIREMAALAPADLLCRAGRRNSLLLAGEIRRAPAVDVWRDIDGADGIPVLHVETGAAQARGCSASAPSPLRIRRPFQTSPLRAAAHVENSGLRLVHRVAGILHDQLPGIGSCRSSDRWAPAADNRR